MHEKKKRRSGAFERGIPWHRRAALKGASVLIAAATLAACGSSTTAKPPAASHVGGTVTFALPPSSPPTAIFPLLTGAQYTNVNLNQFTKFLFRPLYWIGHGLDVVTLDEQRSLAYPPVWSDGDRVVTVRLKHYMWSNGTPVTAQDVVFWQQLITANKDNYGGYVPGSYPDNIVQTKALNASTVQFTLNRPYNRTWFLFNELSQITPLPLAWDKTCATCPAGSAADTVQGAKAVYAYLEGQTKDLSTYATNPLWKIVDGPWVLSQFQPTGYSVFTPNPRYSGPKPKISRFILEPFTSASAEMDAVMGSNPPDVAYLPLTDLPEKAVVESRGYKIAPWVDWNFNFIGLNYHNPIAGPIFKQLYVRQALQHVMDQPDIVKYAYDGYAWPIYSPVPPEPPNPYNVVKTNPYPFSVSAARALLASHGWKEINGVQTCVRPGAGAGECGPGVPAGARMSFTMLLANENPPLLVAMEDYKTDAAEAGIQITITQAPILTVFGDMSPCSGASCSWQMGNYGIGWTYFPDYFPTGGEIFLTGAGSNFGGYSDPVNDANIVYTHTAPPGQTLAAMARYERYLAEQLPVLWQPNYVYQITLVKQGLNGVLPQSPVLEIEPSTWSWSS